MVREKIRPGRVLVNESWVSGGAPMSALGPTQVANPRILALPPVAMCGRRPKFAWKMQGSIFPARHQLYLLLHCAGVAIRR